MVLLAASKAGRYAVPSDGDTATGRWVDDIHLLIDDIEWLDQTERDQIFAGNAQQLFKL